MKKPAGYVSDSCRVWEKTDGCAGDFVEKINGTSKAAVAEVMVKDSADTGVFMSFLREEPADALDRDDRDGIDGVIGRELDVGDLGVVECAKQAGEGEGVGGAEVGVVMAVGMVE